MGIRDAAAKLLLKGRVQELETAVQQVEDAWRRRSYPDQKADLGEMDYRTLQLINQSLSQKTLYGSTPFSMSGQEEGIRTRIVSDSRTMYRWDVVVQRIVTLWTDYGFGQSIEITPNAPEARETWKDFWQGKQNMPLLSDRHIYRLSDTLLVDGEIFLAMFVSTVDGECTLRTFPTEEIKAFITDPEDQDAVLFYLREWTPDNSTESVRIAYPYWGADESRLDSAKLPENTIRADLERDGTYVCMTHANINTMEQRGWPLLTAAFPWARAYRDFLQDRASVARAVAMYVDKLTVEGGSRAVEQVRRSLDSALTALNTVMDRNPPAVAGSTWLQNKQLNRERMPLNTGAGDAQVDGSSLLAQVGLGGGVFAHYLGRGESFRLATATSMEQPILRQWRRYRQLWASVWEEVADIVLTMHEKYGGKTIKDHTVTISEDPLVDQDVDKMSKAISNFYRFGLLPKKEATKLSLQVLNVRNVDEILADMEKRGEFDRNYQNVPTNGVPGQTNQTGGVNPGDNYDKEEQRPPTANSTYPPGYTSSGGK
jgi:hypothetical protein